MNELCFKRTSRFNKSKIKAKLRKDWISAKPTRYRITYRREAFGVRVPARYQATIRCRISGNFDGGITEMWAFVDNKKRLYKTYQKAAEACERHYRTWEKVIQCPSMRTIKNLFNGKKPSEFPVWAFYQIDPHILNILTDRTPQKYDDDETFFEVDSLPEPEPELEPEPVEKRKRKSKLDLVEQAMGQPMPEECSLRSETDTLSETPKKKRGRPKGSKNKKTRSDKGTKRAVQTV